LLNNGYVVEEIRKRFNGHQTRCSIIKYSWFFRKEIISRRRVREWKKMKN
jgi:hypothetical protein